MEDINSIFYQEAQLKVGPSGRAFDGSPIGIVDGCIWIDGVHAYCETPNCPEVDNSELGESKPIGWTVQQI